MESFLLRFRGRFVCHARPRFFAPGGDAHRGARPGRLRSWACGYDHIPRAQGGGAGDEERQNAVFDKKLAQEEVWLRKGVKARRTRNEGRVRELMKLRAERAARRELSGPVRATLQESGRSGYKVITARTGLGLRRALSFRGLDAEYAAATRSASSGRTVRQVHVYPRFAGAGGARRGDGGHGTKLEISYFDQLREALDDEKTVFDNVADGNEYVTVTASGST